MHGGVVQVGGEGLYKSLGRVGKLFNRLYQNLICRVFIRAKWRCGVVGGVSALALVGWVDG